MRESAIVGATPFDMTEYPDIEMMRVIGAGMRESGNVGHVQSTNGALCKGLSQPVAVAVLTTIEVDNQRKLNGV